MDDDEDEEPIGRRGPRRSRRWGAAPTPRTDPDLDDEEELDEEEFEPVPILRPLSFAVAGFALLLGIGLVVGAYSAGPGHRLGFALVVLAAQFFFVAAWTIAIRPPAPLTVAGVSLVVAVLADIAAVVPAEAGLRPLGYVAAGGAVAALLGQLVRASDRRRVTDSYRSTLLIVAGTVSFATLIVLSRYPAGAQAIYVCLTAAGLALAVARVTDGLLPWPRLAPQVPRGAAGVVIGAMVGTLASAVLGSYLVGFTPASAAVVGLVTAATAVLADLAVGYAEAGRLMAGETPTLWMVRHLQGPLGGLALAAPAAYAMCRLFL